MRVPVQPPVAVIGAAGFLGRSLVRSLERAEIPVASYTRSKPFLRADGRPAPGLAAARTIFWLASRINPQTAEREPDLVAADRLLFDDLLRTVQSLRRHPTVVLLSSGGTVYDPDLPPPYDEGARTRPASAYGQAKLQLERRLAEQAPGRHVALRVSNAYGPGQPVAAGQGVLAHWLLAARRGGPLRLLGDPASTRDYIFVDDVSAAMRAVAGHSGPLPAVLNIGSGSPTSLRELAETVLTVVANPALELVVEPPRPWDLPRTWLDVSQAARELGWTPTTVLPDGITAAWDAVSSEPG